MDREIIKKIRASESDTVEFKKSTYLQNYFQIISKSPKIYKVNLLNKRYYRLRRK